MSLSKTVTTDKIEMVDTGLGWSVVQVREAHIITENGQEISRSNHRYSINPTDSWSEMPADVQAICSAVHTSARQTAYSNYMANNTPVDEG